MSLLYWVNNLDHEVLNYLFGLQTHLGNNIFSLITIIGSTKFILVATIVLLVWLFRKGQKQAAYLTVMVVLGSATTTSFLKAIVARPRPDLIPHEVGTFSFPSGHATGVIAFYGLLTYLLLKHQTNKNYRWVIIMIMFTVIFLIGFSRLYLGFHYLSDVLTGYLVGGLWLWGSIFLVKANYFKNFSRF